MHSGLFKIKTHPKNENKVAYTQTTNDSVLVAVSSFFFHSCCCCREPQRTVYNMHGKKIMYRESEAKRKRSDPFPRSQKGIDCIQNRHCTTPHHRNENNDSRNVSHLLHRHSLRVNVQHIGIG